MATAIYDTAAGAPSEPVTVSTFWSTLMSVGGLLFVAGSLGFATVQMRIYEERIAELEGGAVVDVTPADVAVESAAPESAVAELPTASASEAAPADPRIDELEAKVAQLTMDLNAAQTRLEDAGNTIDTLNGEVDMCESNARDLQSRNNDLIRQNRDLRARCAQPPPGADVIR